MFQFFNLMPNLTVLENVGLPLAIAGTPLVLFDNIKSTLGGGVLEAAGRTAAAVPLWETLGLGVPAIAEFAPAEVAGEVLGAVERLTGARGFVTCPLYYTRLPFVHHVALARKWAKDGDLRAKVGHPTRALVNLIDVIDEGFARHQDRVAERSRAEVAASARDAAARGRARSARDPDVDD